MTFAIAVGFDIVLTKKMLQKIIEIAESNINPYMKINKIPPHLTISLFETNEETKINEVFKDICLRVPKEVIQISDVGIFEPKVIYFAPNKSDSLLQLNMLINNKLIAAGIEPDIYYLSNQWIPHITLGAQLTLHELYMALDIVKKDFEPFCAIIERVILAKCNPYAEIIEFII